MKFLLRTLLFGVLFTVAAVPVGVSAATRSNADAQVISSCTTIHSPGLYTLTQDISATTGDCITILASGVTLDLGGHTVRGEFAGTGVHIWRSAEQAQVSNGTVSSFEIGVRVEAPAVLLTDLHIDRTSRAGIALFGSDSSSVAQNEITDGNGLGIYLQHTDYAAVVNNTLTSPGLYGIALQGSSHGTIAGNAVSQSTSAGIYLGCAIAGITYVGDCAPSVGNDIWQNVVSNSSLIGIALDLGSQGNQVMDNTVMHNVQFDLFEAGQECGQDSWSGNRFATANLSCLM